MKNREISFVLNGKPITVSVDVRYSLADLLRNQLHLTGLKIGCAVGECGACTVLIDGQPIDSCIYLAVWADGKEIRTIEGEARDGQLSPVQQAFLDEGATQCGFCIPGFIMSATAIVESGQDYSLDDIRKELSGNMCRCTGYHNIVKATYKALTGHKCKCGN